MADRRRPGGGPAVVWFRRDLRLHDNPAWARATRDHERVAAVYVVDPELRDAAGDHRRQAVDDAVASLDRALDGGLHRLHGDPRVEIPRFAATSRRTPPAETPRPRRRSTAYASGTRRGARSSTRPDRSRLRPARSPRSSLRSGSGGSR